MPGRSSKTPPRRLLIGTRNAAKICEIRLLLHDVSCELEEPPTSLDEFPETGLTFADNARGKARHYSRLTGLTTLADDSGLVVDALDGEPGVLSAQYIDPAMSQASRNGAVLARLRGVPPNRRRARFICHLVLADSDRVVWETTGICDGRIVAEPRGDGGFGYDPIFLLPELGLTMAELTPTEKSRRSHRGAAMRALARFLADTDKLPDG